MDAMGVELAEQRGVWRRLWERRAEVADLVARAAPAAPRRVLFTGCGDCHAAAEYGETLLELRSEFPVRALPAMELSRARGYLLEPGTLLVAASVSGRTPRVLEAVEVAQRRGATVVGITDDPAGPLARAVSLSFVLGSAPPEVLGTTDYRDPEAARYAGYQRPVPQTKSFGAMQLALAFLCLELARLRPSGRGSPAAEVEAELSRLAELAEPAARVAETAAEALGGGPGRRITFCASGFGSSSARFSAYKLLELTVPAAFSDIEEFCHTQYLVTGRGDRVVFFAQDQQGLERVGEIAPVLEGEIGARCVTFATAVGPGGERGHYQLGPLCPETSPLLLSHAGAQLVRRLALAWGLNVNRFRAGDDEERYVRGSTRMIRASRLRVG